MKRLLIKPLAFSVMLAIALSLVGCDIHESNQKDPVYDVPATPIEEFCYSITTDSEAYDYGEEIVITALIQFTFQTAADGNFTVYLEESPYFEILGDKSHVFENINQSDFCCEYGSEDKIEVKFTVKINEPTFTVQSFKILTDFEFVSQRGEDHRAGALREMCYIGDSQGILVFQRPYSYDHSLEKYHSTEEGISLDLGTRDLIIASYNREYLAGVSIEELVDRYILESGNLVKIEKEYDEEIKKYSYCYISAGVRFKIYFPDGHELNNIKCINSSRQNMIKVAEELLLFALENGAITAEEYKAEIERISNEEQILNVSTGVSTSWIKSIIPLDMKYDLLFPIPTDDECFNKVITVTND